MKTTLQQICLVALVILGGLPVAPAQAQQRIEIRQLSFVPAEITIHLGETVVWSNSDPIVHTATAKAGEIGGTWEVLILAGKTVSYQPTQAGKIPYYCRFHPNMKGSIIVLPRSQ